MISKSDTTILKGVAILFMLYLHLFNQIGNVNLCTLYLYIGDVPLTYLFSRCTNPVAFFVILSGYGLYISYRNGKRNFVQRVLRLYVHYWITLLMFIPLGGWIVGTDQYPGSLKQIIENILGWHTTYNAEIWFLFPYLLLVFTYVPFFIYVDRIKPVRIFLWTGSLYFITSYMIHLYGTSYLYGHRWAYWPIVYVNFLFPFSIGMLMARCSVIGNIQGRFSLNNMGWILLLLLFGLRMLIRTNIFNPLYASCFIILFVLIKRPVWLNSVLFKVGERSTSMWFVHTYFCSYFFHDFIYGFRYPLLIFGMLFILSYLSAIIIDQVNSKIQHWMTLYYF